MISTLRQITGALCIVFWLSACGSSPSSNFYRLTAAQPPSSAGQEPSLGIGPIAVAEFLNRNAMVYTRGGNQLQINSTERWAEPLEFGIKRVVGLNLSQLLQTENLQSFPWDLRQAPDYGVKISVIDLDASEGQARMVVDWIIYDPSDGSPITQRLSQFTRPLPPGPMEASALPTAYSALLFELSETIAAVIKVEMKAASDAPNAL